MSLRVLVTGGAGYIGSVLVPTLIERGCSVTVLDNFLYRQTSLLSLCSEERFCAIRGDCRDERVLRQALADADVIIPLAAIVGAPACDADPMAATSINLDAIKLLLKLRSPDQRIVSPCTNSGYGIGEEGKFCDETTPLRPISLYGRTKVEAEQAILDGGNSLSLRLATVFGMSPRMRLDLLVNDFTWRAVNDRAVVLFEAHFRRNFIHVRDVVKAFLHAIDNYESMSGEPYNVGLSEANLTKLQLCERIAKYVPGFVFLEAPIGEDPDKRDYLVSNAKLEKTGWRPDFSIDAGIQELIKGIRMLRNARFGNV